MYIQCGALYSKIDITAKTDVTFSGKGNNMVTESPRLECSLAIIAEFADELTVQDSMDVNQLTNSLKPYRRR